MSALDKSTLTTNIQTDINDNTSNDITAADIRENMIDIVDTLFDMPTSSGFELQANKNQPSGYAGLDASGNIVGPVILSLYDDESEAGIPSSGTLLVVDGQLRLGNTSASGGSPVGAIFPDTRPAITGSTTISLDPRSERAVLYVNMNASNISIDVSNVEELCDGYIVHTYVNKNGAADTFELTGQPWTIGTINPGAFLYVGTYMKMNQVSSAFFNLINYLEA